MIIDYIRYLVYSYFFQDSNPVSTIHGYDKVLQTLPNNSSILDVGCGSGIYFASPKVVRTIKTKKLRIKAIDIDLPATMFCYKRVVDSKLMDHVTVAGMSIMDEKASYDYVVWMESYPVIDSELFEQLFAKSRTLATKKILMYHNLINHKKEPWIYRMMSIFKPLIRCFTLVDFGRVVLFDDMDTKYCNVDLALSCTYGEMSPFLSLIPYVRNLRCNQYIVSSNISSPTQSKTK